MNVNGTAISKQIKDAALNKEVRDKFSSVESKAKLSVNKIEFALLREFYLDMDDSIVTDYFLNQDQCDYVYCLSGIMNRRIQEDIKSGDLWKNEIPINELIHNQNDIYVALIGSMASDKNIWWRLTKHFANPLDQLNNCLEFNNYKLLAVYASGYRYHIATNACIKRPCKHILDELNKQYE